MRDISEASISEEDFSELWDMWFSIMPFLSTFNPTKNQIIIDILYKFRDINHKYNLGLVEE
jgi:hypothetical protein